MSNFFRFCYGIKKPLSCISLWCLILLITDLIWFGTGAFWRETFGFSMRYVWFFFCVLCSIPLIVTNLDFVANQKILVFIWLFFIYLIFAFLVGNVKNNNLEIANQDLLGFANFVILPGMMCLLRTKHNIVCIMKTMVINCVALSFVSCLLSFFSFLPYQELIYQFFNRYQIAIISSLGGGITRIFFHGGTRYLFIGILCASFFYFQEHRKFIRYIWLFCFAIMWLAILFSFTRAIFFGCFIGILMVLYFIYKKCSCYWRQTKWLLARCTGFIIVLLIIFTLALGENPINKVIERSLIVLNVEYITEGSNFNAAVEIESLKDRYVLKKLLYESICENLLFGNGLGTTISYRDGLVEYFYYDLVNKTGLIGGLLFLLPFAFMARITLSRLCGRCIELNYMQIIFFVGLAYFFIITATNPCMNTTTGILYYSIALSVMSYIQHQN